MTAAQQTLGFYVPLEEITITGQNPRKDFDKEGLKALASSIGTHGIIEPLVVRRGKNKKYDLLAGERRLKAAKAAGLKEVPVVVMEIGDEEVQEVMLLENLQREDLKPMEEARALAALEEAGHKRQELADRIGMSHSWVSSRIRLLELPEALLKHLEDGRLTVEQVMAFLPYRKWPVIDKMEKELAKLYQPNWKGAVKDDISTIEVKDLIDNQLRNGNQAQDLDHFGWSDNADEIKRAFKGDKECKACKVPIKYDDIKRLCLNSKCFGKKKRAISKAIKERKNEEAEKLAEKGTVDTSKMAHGTYKSMGKGSYNSPKFDLKDCKRCKSKKTGINNWGQKEKVCVKPTCWNEKQEAVEEARKTLAMEQQRLVHHNVNQFLEGELTIKDLDIRLLRSLIQEMFIWHREDHVIAVKAWAPTKKDDEDNRDLSKIPDDQVRNVVVMLLGLNHAKSLEYDHDRAEGSKLQALLPELFEGEAPPAPEEDEEKMCHRLEIPGPCMEEGCASWDDEKGCTDDVKAELDAMDAEACQKVDETLCDPGAFSECNDCEVYGITESEPEAAAEEVPE